MHDNYNECSLPGENQKSVHVHMNGYFSLVAHCRLLLTTQTVWALSFVLCNR